MNLGILLLLLLLSVIQIEAGDGFIRLVGGAHNYGIVLMETGGEWGSILYGSSNIPRLACKQLGYATLLTYSYNIVYSPVSTDVSIVVITCDDSVEHFSECSWSSVPFDGIDSQQLSISCADPLPEPPIYVVAEEPGIFPFAGGLVLVSYQRELGLLCAPTSLSEASINTICTELGYEFTESEQLEADPATDYSAYYTFITNLDCLAPFHNVSDCGFSYVVNTETCWSPALVKCDTPPELVGAVAGSIGGALFLCVLIWVCCKCCKKRREKDDDIAMYTTQPMVISGPMGIPPPAKATPTYSTPSYAIPTPPSMAASANFALQKAKLEQRRQEQERREELFDLDNLFEEELEDSSSDRSITLPSTQLEASAHLVNFADDMSAIKKRTTDEVDYLRTLQLSRELELRKNAEEQRRQQEARRTELFESSSRFDQARADTRYDRSVTLPSTQLEADSHLRNFASDMSAINQRAHDEFEQFRALHLTREQELAKNREVLREQTESRSSDLLNMQSLFQQAATDSRFDQTVVVPSVTLQAQRKVPEKTDGAGSVRAKLPPKNQATPAPQKQQTKEKEDAKAQKQPEPSKPVAPEVKAAVVEPPKKAVAADPPKIAPEPVSLPVDPQTEGAVTKLLAVVGKEYSERNKEVLLREFITSQQKAMLSKDACRLLEAIFSPFTRISLLALVYPRIADKHRVEGEILAKCFDSDYERNQARAAIDEREATI